MTNPEQSSANAAAAVTALAERERQLSVIFNAIADVTFVLDVEEAGRYRFVFANRAFEEATGLTAAQVVGRCVTEVIPEPALSLVLTKYREAILTKERVVWQEVTDCATGQVTGEVSMTPVCDEAGRCRQLVGVVHDRTAEKRVQEALRRSNERFAYALKATTDAIYDWDVVADTLYWGEGLEQLFGHQLTENPTPFRQWAGWVHPNDSLRTVTGLRRAALETTATFWQEEYRFRRADGSWAAVFDRGYIKRDAAGRAERMIGAMQDITARRQAEARQHELTEKLTRQNGHLQQSGHLISHNLRAPLANALGFAEVLASVDKASPVFAESLDYLRRSLHRLDDVLTDVNLILSIRDQQEVAPPVPVALAEVCQKALQHAQLELAACGADVRVAIPTELRVLGIAPFFHSIFDNLLSNAIKYRAGGRPLRIDIAAITDALGGTSLVFRDNGSGFDRALAGGDIFQMYRRLHPQVPGRGIGLYLVRAHTEAMNGQITVQSHVDEGTQFTLYFTPRADENLPH